MPGKIAIFPPYKDSALCDDMSEATSNKARMNYKRLIIAMTLRNFLREMEMLKWHSGKELRRELIKWLYGYYPIITIVSRNMGRFFSRMNLKNKPLEWRLNESFINWRK